MRQPHVRFQFILAAFLVSVMVLAGCTGKSPKADFYTLGAIPAPGHAGKLSAEIAIAVGPVSIPAELDRKQILTRDAGSRITVAELHRWAGPLQDSIMSVLAANLAVRLGTQKVAPYNRENLFPFTHMVVININRFDGDPAGETVLDATWSIKKTGVPEPLLVQRTKIHRPVTTPGYAGMVAAQSKSLAELSTRIAAAISQLTT